MIDNRPFENVCRDGRSFWLPRRKWRELLFIGALVSKGDYYVRDASRPLPTFRDPDLFPEGVKFRVSPDGKDQVRIEMVG